MNCLITGASVGIGKSLALKLASLNNNIYITYLSNEKKAKELQEEIINNYHVKCFIKKCDLRNEDDIKNVVNDFYNKLGNIEILINNASISHDNLIIDKTKNEFMNVLEVNLVGTFLMTKHSLNYMKDGIVINMSSTDGIDTESIYNIDYSASKAGIISLTKTFSLGYTITKEVV